MKKIEWFPEHNRILINLFKNRPSWCVSRQKVWGLFWPVVSCNTCNKQMLITSLFERYIKEFEE
jgi:isoleucyl-tRNA synthetase